MGGRNGKGRGILAASALVLVLAAGFAGTLALEKRMAVRIDHAGEQMTPHTSAMDTAQVFVNGRWYAERNVETLLLMGVDDLGKLENGDSQDSSRMADFLLLFLRDLDTGRTAAVHLNRDIMTDITVLSLTGQRIGRRHAQLAMAHGYGDGGYTSCSNTAEAVENLLYGIEVDHFLMVTMDAVSIVNDWAGGVTVKVMDDFSGIDDMLVKDSFVRLQGSQALTYVRSRKGLYDSSNIRRMERQRQYAAEWVKCAQRKLNNVEDVADLTMQMDGYYLTSCTAEQLQAYAQNLGDNPSIPTYEVEGEAVKGDVYMEYYVDETALQQLVLELFYAPVE